jgi:hypothetical protein
LKDWLFYYLVDTETLNYFTMWYKLFLNKTLLVIINIGFIPVSGLLMVLGYLDLLYYWDIPTLPLPKGLVVCGAFLLLVSIAGIIALIKEKQTLLLFHVIILIIICIVQISVSIACLNHSDEKLEVIAKQYWDWEDELAPFDSIHYNEQDLSCCGYDESDPRRHDNDTNPLWKIERKWCIRVIDSCEEENNGQMTRPRKEKRSILTVYEGGSNPEIGVPLEATPTPLKEMTCPPCQDLLVGKLGKLLDIGGFVGLFLAFVQSLVGLTEYLFWRHFKKPGDSFVGSTVASQLNYS